MCDGSFHQFSAPLISIMTNLDRESLNYKILYIKEINLRPK
jgi:hypothetical protein